MAWASVENPHAAARTPTLDAQKEPGPERHGDAHKRSGVAGDPANQEAADDKQQPSGDRQPDARPSSKRHTATEPLQLRDVSDVLTQDPLRNSGCLLRVDMELFDEYAIERPLVRARPTESSVLDLPPVVGERLDADERRS